MEATEDKISRQVNAKARGTLFFPEDFIADALGFKHGVFAKKSLHVDTAGFWLAALLTDAEEELGIRGVGRCALRQTFIHLDALAQEAIDLQLATEIGESVHAVFLFEIHGG
jgi:hypothetical protein